MISGPGRSVGEVKGHAYEIRFDGILAPGERKKIVNHPTAVAFRATRLVIPSSMDVDTFIIHQMLTNGKFESRYASLPCSLGNLVAKFPPNHIVLSRCEIGGEIGFDVENIAGHEQRFCIYLLGQGFEE